MALRLVVMGLRARKKTLSMKSVLGSMIPVSCETEKSSPRLSRPVRRQATGSRLTLRTVSVLVSLLAQTDVADTESLNYERYILKITIVFTRVDDTSRLQAGRAYRPKLTSTMYDCVTLNFGYDRPTRLYLSWTSISILVEDCIPSFRTDSYLPFVKVSTDAIEDYNVSLKCRLCNLNWKKLEPILITFWHTVFWKSWFINAIAFSHSLAHGYFNKDVIKLKAYLLKGQ